MNIPFLASLIFWVLWGCGENRLWIEHGEAVILKHFKLYHALMLSMVLVIASTVLPDIQSFVFLCIYAPLALDIAWWVIRYIDIKYKGINTYDGGIGKPWHSQEDWDNYGKLPLVYGTYAWWWLFGGALVIIGALIIL